jgi:undecaprenyl-diphosphatase
MCERRNLMTTFQAILLGLIQGLTEFLPVSSSGHLALAQSLMGGFEQSLLYDTLLHIATLFAVLVYFRDRIWRIVLAFLGLVSHRYKVHTYEQKPMIIGVFIATIPTGVIGLLLKDRVEYLFTQPVLIGYLLVITSVMLFLSDRFRGNHKINLPAAIIVGVAQGLAVFPGISRSGTTIFAGLFAGLSREQAAEFSFLISIPAILGALVLQLPDLKAVSMDGLWIYCIGMAVAFGSGLAAISLMMKIVQRARLSVFAIYCLLVGAAAAIWM